MRWATRAGIHVDRAASAWLIAAFIDPDATFLYIDDGAEVPDDATPFDMVGAALSHVGPDVTFETILRVHGIADPVLWRIGQIVHQSDLGDDRYDAPEADGLDVIIRALGSVHDDESVQRLCATLFDALHHHLRTQALDGLPS